MSKTSKNYVCMFSSEELSTTKTLQQIPKLFTNLELPIAKVVRQALLTARKLDLIPSKSPLRTIWYSIIKKSIENNGVPIKKGDKAFYEAFSTMIKSGDYYVDFKIENSGIIFSKHSNKGFGDSWLCLEKESYFGVFANMKSLLGISVFAGGGQPSLSGTEYILSKYEGYFDEYPKKLNLFSITDKDPSGENISNTFKDQYSLFANRKGCEVELKRVGTSPEYYTPSELKDALYEVKSPNQKRWNTPEMDEMRKKFNMSKTQGLEVESLPADPTPIFTELFPSYKLNSWIGLARIRLIVFKELLEKFGIKGFMSKWLDECFSNSEKAEEIAKTNSDLYDFNPIRSEITNILSDIEYNLDDLIKKEKDEIKEQIDEWSNEFIEEKLDNKEYEEEFTQKLINAVSKDSSWCNTKDFYDEMDEEITDYEFSEEKKEKIQIVKEKTDEKMKKVLADLEKIKEELAEEIEEILNEEN
ncbi:MAG: hypothetical protein ACTSP9_03135 [Promethearchaeota archaeon]